MLVVSTLSLVFATASLLGSCYIVCATSSSVWQQGSSHQVALQRILLAISFSDVLGGASWISTQAQALSGRADNQTRCLLAGIIGQFAFTAMSLWTAIFAACIRSVLVAQKSTLAGMSLGGGSISALVTGISAIATGLLSVGHAQSCYDSGPDPNSWEQQLKHATWRVCFVAVPVATIILCLAEYARVVRHYRQAFESAASDLAVLTQTIGDDGAGPMQPARTDDAPPQLSGHHMGGDRISQIDVLREVHARGLKLSLALNRRLLLYLLAYVACELPGVPAAMQQAFTAGDDNEVYRREEEGSMLVAVRVLTQSLQGLANAMAFVHHTGKLQASCWCMRRGYTVSEAASPTASANHIGVGLLA